MSQRKTAGRVMHEFAHGELKSGRGGKAGKVKSRRQAIAIALKEAGASKYDGKRANKRNFAKSKRDSSRAVGGKNARTATRRTPKQRHASASNARKAAARRR